MSAGRLPGRINVRFLIILVVAAVILAGGAAVGYKVRSRIIAGRAKTAGLAALERKDWVEASKQLQQYLSRHPDDPDMLRSYAEASLSIRPLEPKHLAAAASAHRWLFSHKADASSGRELSGLYMKLGNFNEAAHICRQRLERDPKDTDARLGLAKSLLGQRKLAEATTELASLLEQDASQAKAYALLVEIMLTQGTEPAAPQVFALLKSDGRAETQPAGDVPERLLNLGIERNPGSAMLLVTRARYYRTRASRTGASRDSEGAKALMAAARSDLEAADKLPGTEVDTRLALFEEWLQHGDTDRAGAQLAALDQLDAVKLREQGIYSADELKLPKLKAAAMLVLGKGQKDQAVALADRARQELSNQQWVGFVPLAVRLHLLAKNAAGARKALDDARAILKEKPPSEGGTVEDQLSFLEAQLAAFQREPYTVINLLEPLVARYPDSAVAWRLLAEAYLQTGQTQRALRVSQDLTRLASDQSQADYSLMEQLLRNSLSQGRAKEAQQLAAALKTVADKSPELQLLLLRADILAAPDNAPARLEAWSKQLDQLDRDLPRSADVHFLQAILEMRRGRVDEAIAWLERAVRDCDDSVQASLALAGLYAESKNNRTKAIEICTAAAEKSRDKAAPRVALALHQNADGLKEQAQATLEKAVSELSGSEKGRATYALAVLLISAGDPAKGIGLLDRYALEQPRDLRVRVLLLSTVERQTDPAARQKLVDELKAIEGDRGLRWRVEQAKAHLQQIGAEIKAPRDAIAGREEEIAGLLRSCIDADPAWVEPVLVLGGMYERLGQPDRAEQVYRRLLEASPAEMAVLDRLSALLQDHGRLVEANELLSKVPPELLRESDPLFGRQVNVALGLGDTGKAAAILDEMVSSKSEDPTARILRAKIIALQRGDLDRASRLLDEAEKLARPPASAPATASDARRDAWLLEILAARVAIHHARGQDQAASAMLDREVARRKDFQAHLLRAQFRATLGQFDLAEQDYTRLTEFPDRVPRGHVLLGVFYGVRNAIDKALATWEAGLKAAPDDVQLRRLLVGVLLEQPKKEYQQRGLALLDESLARSPNNPDPELLTLRALTSNGERAAQATDLAVAALEKALRADSHNLQAHRNLIRLAFNKGDARQTRQRLAQALGARPNDTTLLLLAAGVERDLRNPAGAAAYAQAVLKKDASNLDAHRLLVQLALSSRDFAAAESSNKKLLALAPEDETARLMEAAILQALHRGDEAIARLEAFRTTENGRTSLGAMLSLAQLYVEKKELPQAARQIEEAEKSAPDNPAVLSARFSWLAAQDKIEELLALAKQRAEASAQPSAILLAAGGALAGTGKTPNLREAIGLFRRASELDPENPAAPAGWAETAYKVKDFELAAAGYRALLRIRPDDPDVLNSLAWVLGVELNRLDEAIQLANRGIATHASDPHLLDTRGALLLRLNRLEEARADLEKCLDLPELPVSTRLSALGNIGEVYAKLGQAALAKEKITEALRIDGEQHVLAENERAKMESLLKSLR